MLDFDSPATPGLDVRPRGQTDAGPAELRYVPIQDILVPPRPARRFLGDIPSLADSMQQYGLQQPISVRLEGDQVLLTSGMRRLAAARLLGWSTIPAWVRSLSADDAYLIDLIENLQREDLSPEEEADAFRELIRTRGWTLQQVADSVKRSVGYVSKRVRVFEDTHLKDAILRRGLPISTAEELLAATPAQRQTCIERAIAEHWDQGHTREALRPHQPATLDPAAGALPAERTFADVPRAAASRRPHDADQDGDRADDDERRRLAGVRPRGFTRAVREFHRIVIGLHAEELTPADRSALRALFRDLVLLARAPTTSVAPVFPPLPIGGRRAPSTGPLRQSPTTATRHARSQPAARAEAARFSLRNSRLPD